MTKLTLVLISNAPEAKKIAQKNKSIFLLTHQEASLQATDGRVINLPNKSFSLRRNVHTASKAWLNVLVHLEEFCGPNFHVVIDYYHPLRELMLVAGAIEKFGFSLLLNEEIARVTVPEYALLGSAKNIFCYEESHAASLHKSYVGHYSAVSLNEWQNAQPQTEKSVDPATKKKSLSQQNNPKPIKALLVSYFSGPCRTVGVQRINYWAEQLSTLSNNELEVHLATAIDWQSDYAQVHFVPDHHIASLLNSSGEFPKWSKSFHENEVFDAKHFNTLSYYWRYALEKYFKDLGHKFDTVIITGNPFAVFDFAAYAKRHWYSKVFLDYRDPFANNPRIKYNDIARDYAKHVERGYNFQADVCVSVNDTCIDLLEGGDEARKLMIPNGYDERIFENIKVGKLEGNKINFVHAGSFYHNSPPRALITQLDQTKHRFHHIGNTTGIDDDVLSCKGLICHGSKPHNEAIEILGAGDCGVVYISETGFESPTKLYEYIALGLDVLICTTGFIKSGALKNVLANHPTVYWCTNTEEGIREFLDNYVPSKTKKLDKEPFTRQHSTMRLIEAIKDLHSPLP